jgi:hydroxymethylbilane synthase
MAQVESERKQFKAYGGGCHQKIGISKFSVAGKHEMTIVRGETPNGELLNSVVCLTPKAELLNKLATDYPGAVWNSYRELKSLTQRVARNPQVIKDLKRRYESSSPDGLVWWVSKSAAMPEYFIDSIRPQDRVWASGIKTQKELMQKGVWVCGNSESLGVHSLGVSYPMSWDNKKPQNVVYLTHGEAPDVDLFGEKVTTLATYDLDFSALKSINQEKLFSNRVFLWGAASHFKAMLHHFPQLFKDKKMERYHFCGLGRSYDEIKALAVNEDIEIAPVLMNDFI